MLGLGKSFRTRASRRALPGRDTDVYVLDEPNRDASDEPNRDASIAAVGRDLHVMPSRFGDRPWGMWSAGALMTAALHSLLVTSVVLGGASAKRRPPPTEGFHAVERNAEGNEFVSALVLLKDSSISKPNQDNDSAYSAPDQKEQLERALSIIASTAATVTPSIPMLDETDHTVDASAQADGDGAEVAMLFGRYMGQVKARIDRAWTFPVNPTSRAFRCKAQIKQSKKGDVQEITLQQCDMKGDWQASLIKAIQSASPLSAPPSEKVFTEIITLSFEAELNAQDTATHIAAKLN